jgi:hydroxymethylpyrimidine/phosphomethylpyrimidine kinase
MNPHPVVLTIAGSESGGGAGLQADIKTMTALGAFGAGAVTCVTAQNPDGVEAITALSPELVLRQLLAVCTDFPVAAAKTGLLFSAEIIRAVASADVQAGIPVLVVDPVMVSRSGAQLLQPDAVAVLCEELIPLARVVTPNLHEAEVLWGRAIPDIDAMCDAARAIAERFDVACLIKGGRLPGPQSIDVLVDGEDIYELSAPRIDTPAAHGAGCCLSAALATFLGRGDLLPEAVEKAKAYVGVALAQSIPTSHHHPLNFLNAGAGFHSC